MAKNKKRDLIIVESPTKAKTINKFLGNKYFVVASMGHIRDLPKSDLGVNEKTYEPKYVIPPKSKKNVKKLKDSYKKAKNVYLATDEDREGEAISWHISHILSGDKKLPKKDLKRITFHEITDTAIDNALKNPHDINNSLVNAQQARRVLDRLVGYKLSPVLWKKLQYGLSAGRVQSVALRLIVEREREREAFNVETYYTINSIFENDSAEFPSSLHKIDDKRVVVRKKDGENEFLITSKESAEEVVKDVQTKSYTVAGVDKKDRNRKTYPPYITSTLQQAASNLAGFSSSRTMRAAQKLYEKGMITYHRTDSTNLSKKFADSVKTFITSEMGEGYYSKNTFKGKSKNAQEAHEAIRPTNLKDLPKNINVSKDEAIIYELIFARSVASLMKPIKTKHTSIKISSDDKKYLFKTTGSELVFDGWAKAYKLLNILSYNPLSGDTILPDVNEKDTPKLKEANYDEKKTQPPARYSEASLIKELEAHGIGRPSTYAPTISTLMNRNYVEKENKYFSPTDLGSVVIKLLEDNFKTIMDYEFTAKVESELDEVAGGNMKWEKVVDEFYKPFIEHVEDADKNIDRNDYKILGDAPENIKCPECDSKMVIKLGRKGKFYSCSKFPDCKGARFINGETQEDIENKTDTKEFKELYKPAPKTKDGRDYVLKKGRFGEFWAHPDYPKVKDAQPLEYKDKVVKEKFGEAPKTKDGKRFVFRQGKYGPFWAHPEYPKVKETRKIEKND